MFLDVISYGYLLLIINNLRNPALNHNPQVPRSNRGFATKDIKGLAQASCRIPDDHISIRSWKLAAAREVLATLLTSLGVTQS